MASCTARLYHPKQCSRPLSPQQRKTDRVTPRVQRRLGNPQSDRTERTHRRRRHDSILLVLRRMEAFAAAGWLLVLCLVGLRGWH